MGSTRVDARASIVTTTTTRDNKQTNNHDSIHSASLPKSQPEQTIEHYLNREIREQRVTRFWRCQDISSSAISKVAFKPLTTSPTAFPTFPKLMLANWSYFLI